MTTDIFEFSHNMSMFTKNALLGVGLGFGLRILRLEIKGTTLNLF